MSAIQTVSLAIQVVATILTICCVALPYWKVNDPEDTIRDNIQRHQGLWLQCSSYATGNWDCDDFNRFFLGLGKELQADIIFLTLVYSSILGLSVYGAARGFSLTSITLAVFAMIAMVVGMDSIPCGGDDKRLKRRIRLISGCLALIAGLLIIAAVSWYANDVRIEHELFTQQLLVNTTLNVNRYIFGVCLFLGWIGGVLLIMAGLFGFCTGCGGDLYEDAQPRYGYRPPTKTVGGGQEYV